MRVRSAIAAVLGALVLLSAGAVPALALPPGVHVDPGSPAGKEYSFPLSVLRGAAGGKKASQGTSPPLFGVGITRPRASGSARSPYGSSGQHGSAGPRHIVGAAPRRRSPRRAAHGPSRGQSQHGASRGQSQRGSGSPEPGRRRGTTTVRSRTLASLIRPQSPVPQVGLIALAVLLAAVALGAGIAVGQRRS